MLIRIGVPIIAFYMSAKKVAKSKFLLSKNSIPRNTGIESGIDPRIPKTGIENKSVFWKL